MSQLELGPARFISRSIPVGLFLGVFLLTAVTSSDYGVAWDEPYYFHAADLHVNWLTDFANNTVSGRISDSLKDEAIVAAWHWDPFHVPHPPFSRLVSGIFKALFFPVIDKFTAYRIGPALFFSVLVTVMYVWMAALFDRLTGLFSALALVLTPNLFGFAHLAVTDMPLTAMWFVTLYCFWRGLGDWRWSVILGVVWGLALCTKFPALLIPLPLILWAHLCHRKSYQNNIFSMVFLSPPVMIASQPYLWHHPTVRILEFLFEGLTRGYRFNTNYLIFFFGEYYASREVPWYYAAFMTAVTVPETLLLFSMLGLMAIFWFKPLCKVMFLFGFNILFILGLGLFPGAVLHDVNRLMLPVLPYLAALSGFGFYFFRGMVRKSASGLARQAPAVFFALALVLPAIDLIAYHPYELSYYNRLIGGLRGAYRRGMEITYFMDAMNPQFLSYLNDKLPPHAVINAYFSNTMLEFYQREGRLRQDLRVTNGAEFEYYIFLNRQSIPAADDPSFAKTLPVLEDAFRVNGVPLILIYKARN